MTTERVLDTEYLESQHAVLALSYGEAFPPVRERMREVLVETTMDDLRETLKEWARNVTVGPDDIEGMFLGMRISVTAEVLDLGRDEG